MPGHLQPAWRRAVCVAINICQERMWPTQLLHDDVIKWKHFPRYWPFVLGIHWSPVNSPHKGKWLGALMFPLICAWINDWVNNAEAGDLRRHRAHYDVIVNGRTCALLIFGAQFVQCSTVLKWNSALSVISLVTQLCVREHIGLNNGLMALTP